MLWSAIVVLCLRIRLLSQETEQSRAAHRVGVGSTSHEKDTILKRKALSGARDGLFVCRLVYTQYTVSLYSIRCDYCRSFSVLSQ